MSIRTAARALAVLGMIGAVLCELRAGTPLSIFVLLVAVWVALPFLLLFRAAGAEQGRASEVLWLIGSIALVITAFVAYRPPSMSSSSTAGLAFVFLPLWQLMGVGVLAFVATHVGGMRDWKR